MFTVLCGLGLAGTVVGAKLGWVDLKKDVNIPFTNRVLHLEFSKENPMKVDWE